MMMRHLLWKDSVTIKPLVVAILVSVVAIYAIMLVATSTLGSEDSASLYVSFWILMPNLVALGAPALLVGGEEESGTLQWLRSLPVSWQSVADAKFIVALVSMIIVWIVSSLFLLAMTNVLSINFSVIDGVRLTQNSGGSYVQDILRPGGILYLLFFSSLLLICGFITAYVFRSPVAGLIAVIPLILLSDWFASEVGRFMLTGKLYADVSTANAGFFNYLWVGVTGLSFLIAGWFLQRFLACRRLTSAQTNRMKDLSGEDAGCAYRPPVMVGTTSHPSATRALLWQHIRQTAPASMALTFIICVSVVFHVGWPGANDMIQFLNAISPAVIALGASWLGGLVFYGDNVGGRRSFFADRGVSVTQVWVTRFALPMLLFLVVLSVVVLTHQHQDRRYAELVAVIFVAFFTGQLVGQWMKRPVMTFFVGPALSAICLLMLFFVFDHYPNFQWTVAFFVPVMLLASWRLAGRWLCSRVNAGYHWRAFSYTALAVALPFVAILSVRYATTPKPISSWRSTIAATKTPKFRVYPNGRLQRYRGILPDAFSSTGTSPTFTLMSSDEKEKLFADELSSDLIGNDVSMDDIEFVLKDRSRRIVPLQRQAIAVLLKWDRQVREGVLRGDNVLIDLEKVAERSETMAIHTMEVLIQQLGPTPELRELVESIPDQELRYQSRRVALIGEWKAYDRSPWRHKFPNSVEYSRWFVDRPIAERISRIPLERTRADRYIDRLTQLLVNQLDHGLPKNWSAASFQQRELLWREAMTPSSRRGSNYLELPVCRNWTSDHEEDIARLRARFQ